MSRFPRVFHCHARPGPIQLVHCLFTGDGADLGHFGDLSFAGNRAHPRDGTEDGCHVGQTVIARDGTRRV